MSTARAGAHHPAPSERPSDTEEAAKIMKNSSGSVLFVGGGTKQRWGASPREPELVIETGGMSSIISHAPADMTAAVQAGMTLSELQRILTEHGQWLALDPPSEAGGATVGGLLASGDSGPRRLRYGTLRDLVIGATMVLADGTVAHTGGRVIKNVAGYDLAKLMYGSLGTLGLVTEVVVRLHPLPEASATVTAECTVQEATTATLKVLASPLEPAAIQWDTPVGANRMHLKVSGLIKLRYDGSQTGVLSQAASTRQLFRDLGITASLAADSDELWRDLIRPLSDGDGVARLRAGTKPTDLPAAARALAESADETGCQALLSSQCGVGIHTVQVSGTPDGQSQCINQWRSAVLRLNGNVLVQDRPPLVDASLDVLGPPPSSVQLLRALKQRLDPTGRCAPGRFGTWY